MTLVRYCRRLRRRLVQSGRALDRTCIVRVRRGPAIVAAAPRRFGRSVRGDLRLLSHSDRAALLTVRQLRAYGGQIPAQVVRMARKSVVNSAREHDTRRAKDALAVPGIRPQLVSVSSVVDRQFGNRCGRRAASVGIQLMSLKLTPALVDRRTRAPVVTPLLVVCTSRHTRRQVAGGV